MCCKKLFPTKKKIWAMYIRRLLTGLRKENKMNLRSRKKYLKRWFLIPVISWLEFESKIIGGLTNKSIILF